MAQLTKITQVIVNQVLCGLPQQNYRRKVFCFLPLCDTLPHINLHTAKIESNAVTETKFSKHPINIATFVQFSQIVKIFVVQDSDWTEPKFSWLEHFEPSFVSSQKNFEQL